MERGGRRKSRYRTSGCEARLGIRPTSVLLHTLSVLERKRVVESPPQVLDDEMREEAKEESDEEEERKEGKRKQFSIFFSSEPLSFRGNTDAHFWGKQMGLHFLVKLFRPYSPFPVRGNEFRYNFTGPLGLEAYSLSKNLVGTVISQEIKSFSPGYLATMYRKAKCRLSSFPSVHFSIRLFRVLPASLPLSSFCLFLFRRLRPSFFLLGSDLPQDAAAAADVRNGRMSTKFSFLRCVYTH